MAAPVRIEDFAFSDPRIELMGSIAGYNRYEALGRLAHLWRICTERGEHSVSDTWVVSCLGPNGVKALIDSALGFRTEEGMVHVKGTTGRIEWLQQKRVAGQAGGQRTSSRRAADVQQKVAPAKQPLDFATQNEQQTSSERVPNEYPLTLPLTSASYEADKRPPQPPEAGGLVSGRQPRKPKTFEETDPRFLRFWESYPRKVAKPDAARAFAKIDPSEELLEEILSAVGRAVKSDAWTKDGGQFIPHPATWLNKRRWEDKSPEVNGTTLPKLKYGYIDLGGADPMPLVKPKESPK